MALRVDVDVRPDAYDRRTAALHSGYCTVRGTVVKPTTTASLSCGWASMAARVDEDKCIG